MNQPGGDEPSLVAALMCGEPPLSRNKNFELLSSDVGRRARRRAAFLRSIARDIERVRHDDGLVTIDRGAFARGGVRVFIQHAEFTRRAYLTEAEIGLISQAYPLAARVFDL